MTTEGHHLATGLVHEEDEDKKEDDEGDDDDSRGHYCIASSYLRQHSLQYFNPSFELRFDSTQVSWHSEQVVG